MSRRRIQRHGGNGMLTGIVIDALDVARMDRFWQEATRGRTDGLRLRFEQTATPKTGKNRLHLDLAGGRTGQPRWLACSRSVRAGSTSARGTSRGTSWPIRRATSSACCVPATPVCSPAPGSSRSVWTQPRRTGTRSRSSGGRGPTGRRSSPTTGASGSAAGPPVRSPW
ncbi:VOC family protein [Streptomyces lavendulae]|uniref:VOC family protein n=1 Tax=Streptomyces lavendulae TaxID=1914 RepID=UPI003714D1F8